MIPLSSGRLTRPAPPGAGLVQAPVRFRTTGQTGNENGAGQTWRGLGWRCHPPHVLGDRRFDMVSGFRWRRWSCPPGSRPTLISAAAALLLPFLSAFVRAAPAVWTHAQARRSRCTGSTSTSSSLAWAPFTVVTPVPVPVLQWRRHGHRRDVATVDHVDPSRSPILTATTLPAGHSTRAPTATSATCRVGVPSSWDNRTWNFRFDNTAYGDAQVKLYVLCHPRFRGAGQRAQPQHLVGMLGPRPAAAQLQAGRSCAPGPVLRRSGIRAAVPHATGWSATSESGPNPSRAADAGLELGVRLSNPNHPASFGNATFYSSASTG